MSNSVVIKRCATLNEAYILQGLLAANGFDARLDEANHAAMNWWLIPALNGVAIRLPITQAAEAKRTVLAIAETAPANLEKQFGPYEAPRKYGRASVWFYWLSFFGLLQLMFIGSIILLDRLVPDAWLPITNQTPYISAYYGGGINVNWERAGNGFVLMFFMIGLLIFEFFSTRPQKPPKEPQP